MTDEPPDSGAASVPSRPDGLEWVCTGILRTEFGRRPSRAVANAIQQLAADQALASRLPAPSPAGWRRHILNGWAGLRRHPAYGLGFALILAVGLGWCWIRPAGRFGSAAVSPLGAVCLLSDALAPQWAASQPAPETGAALPPGSWRLQSGVVELTFASKARVAVEGPAEFTLISTNSMELQAGKMSTDVPRHARGFTLKTPTTTVVDLGTRFGAIVGSDRSSEVDVFQGRVKLSTVPTSGRPASQWRLTPGMAMFVDLHDAVAATALPEDAFPQPARSVMARPQNCGFDLSGRAAIGDVPVDFGYWSGPAYLLTGPTMGVRPGSGPGMLQFYNPPSPAATESPVWQLVDLHPYDYLLAGGQATANLTVQVNRIAGPAYAGAKFGLTLAAFHGSPADAKTLWAGRESLALTLADQELTVDDDPATWEKISINARLPAGTDFVIVEVRALSPKPGTGQRPSFTGYFADNVDMNLDVPMRASSLNVSR